MREGRRENEEGGKEAGEWRRGRAKGEQHDG